MAIDLGWAVSLTLGLAALTFVFSPRSRVFRFCELTLLGTSVGIVISEGFWILVEKTLVPMIQGKYLYIVPFILGLMFFLRLHPKGVLYARIPLAFFFAIQIPLFMTRMLASEVIKQSVATIRNPLDFHNLVFMIVVIFSLLFFFFSAKPKGSYEIVRKIGLSFWMVQMAVLWVTTGMLREQVFIARLMVLLSQLGLIK